MLRTILALAIAGTGLASGIGAATAQSVYVERPAVVVEPEYRGARVYGYYSDYDYDDGDRVVVERSAPTVELRRPDGPGGCGTYFYWNGFRCVDARNR